MGVNSVTLVGRAGRDPEVRYFESGSMVANLTMAVNRRSRDDEPDWFNLEIWGKQPGLTFVAIDPEFDCTWPVQVTAGIVYALFAHNHFDLLMPLAPPVNQATTDSGSTPLTVSAYALDDASSFVGPERFAAAS